LPRRPVQDELAWAGKELGVTALYADFREFLADAHVDAVFLVTPTSLHAEQIVQALQAGKHVFCEKPLSLELGDCLRVEELVAKHPRLKVMSGYGRRFDPVSRCVRQGPRGHDRQAVPGTVTKSGHERSVGLFRALRAHQRRHLPRLHGA
jgi:hypothetical protein